MQQLVFCSYRTIWILRFKWLKNTIFFFPSKIKFASGNLCIHSKNDKNSWLLYDHDLPPLQSNGCSQYGTIEYDSAEDHIHTSIIVNIEKIILFDTNNF